MKNLPGLSVFFPCYNDAGTIKGLVEQALQTGKTITEDLEVIVVDDGSKDKSPEILAALSRIIPELRVFYHSENRGYGAALRSGFSHAGKDYIFYTDGDGQYDVRELPLLVESMGQGVDLVNGYKLNRSDPWYRNLVGGAYRGLMRWMFGIGVRDIDCDFRLFKRGLLEGIELCSDSGAICVEMLSKFQQRGVVFAEVGIHHYARQYGSSQFFTFRHVSRSILGLIRLWWRLKILKKG
jgi:glycosyltransferase involved in cell wall biosynthesis